MKNLTDLELIKFPTNSFAFFTQSQDLIKEQMKLLVLLNCVAVYLSREAPVDKQLYLLSIFLIKLCTCYRKLTYENAEWFGTLLTR